jgi:hypothetical protein
MPVNYATPAPEALFPVAGVRLGTAEAGIRKKDRRDLTLVELAPGSRAAGRVHAEPLLRGAGDALPRAPGGRRQPARAGDQYRHRQCRDRRAGHARGARDLRCGGQSCSAVRRAKCCRFRPA